VADDRIQVEALANSEEAFGVGFDKTWMSALTGRMSANETFAFQLLDNHEAHLGSTVSAHIGSEFGESTDSSKD
jgi:hypothetical protein